MLQNSDEGKKMIKEPLYKAIEATINTLPIEISFMSEIHV